MQITLDWASLGPYLATGAAGVAGFLVRATWSAIAKLRDASASKDDIKRLDTELAELRFKLDRFEENCAARYVAASKP